MRLLTLNSGSSSIKFALFQADDDRLPLLLSGKLERIGLSGGVLQATGAQGQELVKNNTDLPNHDVALERLQEWLKNRPEQEGLGAVGHRLVHGGQDFHQPILITDDVLTKLQTLLAIAPDHLPHQIAAIKAMQRLHPELPQVACFDTAFHWNKPRVAQLYGLPTDLSESGCLRYGFHGLSYEYIVEELRAAGPLPSRIVAAHLGNGASVTAIRNGQSMDNSMGFTPSAGITMSDRSGDLDPSIILYLLQERHFTVEQLAELVNKKGGVHAVSGVSSDFRDLMAREADDPHCAEAINLFCYQVKKWIGAYCAVLGGLDLLVFAGGIGEHAAPVRARICAGLEALGIHFDTGRNDRQEEIISAAGSPVPVRIVKTNEEQMIARHTHRLVPPSR